MAKGPFKMRSGNATPFKEMGSSAVKGIFDIGLKVAAGLQDKPKSEFKKLSDWEATTKQENIDNEVQAVVDKTDKQIASTKTTAETKSYKDRVANVREREISLKEKIHADKTSTKKTGPSIEQQLADKKVSDLKAKTPKTKLGKWIHKKRLKRAEKMTDPLNRAKKDLRKAMAQDISQADRTGGAQTQQNIVRARHRDSQINQDVKTYEKTENQEELPNEQIVDDGSYIAASDSKSSKSVAEQMGMGFEPIGENPRQDDRNYDEHGNYKSDNPEIYASEKRNYQPGDPEWEKKRQELIDRANKRTT